MKKYMAALTVFLVAIASLGAEAVNLDEAIRLSTADICSKLAKDTKVIILNVQSASPSLSDYVIEEMTLSLVQSGSVIVLDRKDLDLIQQEMKFQLSGEVSDESAQSIGKKLGAQSIISGSVTNIGTCYRFRMKSIEVVSATIQNLYAVSITDATLVSFLTADESARPVTIKPLRKTPMAQGNFEIIDGKKLKAPIDRAKFKAIALESLSALNYEVLPGSPEGVIEAKLSKTSWWVKIRICYWDDEYWFEYLDSMNLDANPKRNKIHRNYTRWIANLDEHIGAGY